MEFDLPKYRSNTIKVIGVGGGGSNAVNYMHNLGLKYVDFAVCNTDAQALEQSSIHNKIQLGPRITEGLGVGGDPKIGEKAAQESIKDIEELFGANTKMIFITAGMGGGTGTGAAPVIAKKAKEKDILTIGIVTIPFDFEGPIRKKYSQEGIENLRENVDSLLIIDNNNILKIYGDLPFNKARKKADEILAIAAKGISEIITKPLHINIDLNDVKKVLKNSGKAMLGTGNAKGESRAIEAIKQALNSPLLEDNKIIGCSDILLSIFSSEEKNCTAKEIEIIIDFIRKESNNPNVNVLLGEGENNNLSDGEISVTIIATNFNKKTIASVEQNQESENIPENKNEHENIKIIDFDFEDNDDPNKDRYFEEKSFDLDKGNSPIEYTFDLDTNSSFNNDNCIIFELNEENDTIKSTIVNKNDLKSYHNE